MILKPLQSRPALFLSALALIFLAPTSVRAETLSLKTDTASFQMKKTARAFTYIDQSLNKTVLIKPCNKKVIETFFSETRSFAKNAGVMGGGSKSRANLTQEPASGVFISNRWYALKPLPNFEIMRVPQRIYGFFHRAAGACQK